VFGSGYVICVEDSVPEFCSESVWGVVVPGVDGLRLFISTPCPLKRARCRVEIYADFASRRKSEVCSRSIWSERTACFFAPSLEDP
jgi:hypothetical protein